jgi:hypothetical protein
MRPVIEGTSGILPLRGGPTLRNHVMDLGVHPFAGSGARLLHRRRRSLQVLTFCRKDPVTPLPVGCRLTLTVPAHEAPTFFSFRLVRLAAADPPRGGAQIPYAASIQLTPIIWAPPCTPTTAPNVPIRMVSRGKRGAMRSRNWSMSGAPQCITATCSIGPAAPMHS